MSMLSGLGGAMSIVVPSAVAGGAAAVILTVGGTQIAEQVTQPAQTSVNTTNVSDPNYAQ